mmetsp:Transcript_54095/g.114906  ORF Transcript_54095/g.114906 Transcript_54095/m.114906 type:complete len:334 (+) Transcript_54095:117-1118(+)|eukprot:CAMPEP_0172550834 /NCGR_PEP_ID=MMETSP1067-20121228/33367_1 /TAXON_ID=265564 ORGANISM="Thalassiosira punctigera, Strain Tpunct2005C2" /NCGR_SAMPLE_ID=MMETSP1067 /ASSEMBLY_ACC=CAM_ASM_000444 /LENGTH=333 /DNA_ID=CAMNT_0013338511 /DNA_START=116 /DNA_END=1117 /DNA_ORIENTATION=+
MKCFAAILLLATSIQARTEDSSSLRGDKSQGYKNYERELGIFGDGCNKQGCTDTACDNYWCCGQRGLQYPSVYCAQGFRDIPFCDTWSRDDDSCTDYVDCCKQPKTPKPTKTPTTQSPTFPNTCTSSLDYVCSPREYTFTISQYNGSIDLFLLCNSAGWPLTGEPGISTSSVFKYKSQCTVKTGKTLKSDLTGSLVVNNITPNKVTLTEYEDKKNNVPSLSPSVSIILDRFSVPGFDFGVPYIFHSNSKDLEPGVPLDEQCDVEKIPIAFSVKLEGTYIDNLSQTGNLVIFFVWEYNGEGDEKPFHPPVQFFSTGAIVEVGTELAAVDEWCSV